MLIFICSYHLVSTIFCYSIIKRCYSASKQAVVSINKHNIFASCMFYAFSASCSNTSILSMYHTDS